MPMGIKDWRPFSVRKNGKDVEYDALVDGVHGSATVTVSVAPVVIASVTVSLFQQTASSPGDATCRPASSGRVSWGDRRAPGDP